MRGPTTIATGPVRTRRARARRRADHPRNSHSRWTNCRGPHIVNVIERGGGLRTATLGNGTKVNVRPFSSGKFPTLEIDTPGNPLLKIRC
jgi:hypothetical protein